ncbi:VOC family protein [Streptomyces sparsus]
MPVQLNHTLVHASDRKVSAEFLADMLGLEVGPPYGPFLPVSTANGVTLDFVNHAGPITSQHYAFLVTEYEFDRILARIKAAGVTHYADPSASRPNTINHEHGGRGTYFADPDGHYLEILTSPYGAAD